MGKEKKPLVNYKTNSIGNEAAARAIPYGRSRRALDQSETANNNGNEGFEAQQFETPSRNNLNSIFSRITSAIATPISSLFSRLSPQSAEITISNNRNHNEPNRRETMGKVNDSDAMDRHETRELEEEEEEAGHISNTVGLETRGLGLESRIFSEPKSSSYAAFSTPSVYHRRKTQEPIDSSFNTPAPTTRFPYGQTSLLSDYFARRKDRLNVGETDSVIRSLDEKAAHLIVEGIDSDTGKVRKAKAASGKTFFSTRKPPTGRKTPVFYGALYGNHSPTTGPSVISSSVVPKATRIESRPPSTSYLIQALSSAKDVEMIESHSHSGTSGILVNSKKTPQISGTAQLILKALNQTTQVLPVPVPSSGNSGVSSSNTVGGTWCCLSCKNINKMEEGKCLKCGTKYSGSSLSTNKSGTTAPAPSNPNKSSSIVASTFQQSNNVLSTSNSNSNTSQKNPPGINALKWSCSVCLVSNDAEKSICVCCETPNPNQTLNKPTASSSISIANHGGKWNCSSCLVSNDAEKSICVCCEMPNPNLKESAPASVAPQVKSFGGISFGQSINGGSAASAVKSSFGGISFGAAPSVSFNNNTITSDVGKNNQPSKSISSGISFGNSGFKVSIAASENIPKKKIDEAKTSQDHVTNTTMDDDDDDDVIVIDSDSDEASQKNEDLEMEVVTTNDAMDSDSGEEDEHEDTGRNDDIVEPPLSILTEQKSLPIKFDFDIISPKIDQSQYLFHDYQKALTLLSSSGSSSGSGIKLPSFSF